MAHTAKVLIKSRLLEFLTRESPVEARFPTSSGVAVKATGKELSLVFVRLPYLSNHGPNANGPFTTNLSKYMSHQTKNSVEGEDHVWVHQVWFAIFQDYAILTAKSFRDANQNKSYRPVLAPDQPRHSALHALIHVISHMIRSSGQEMIDRFEEVEFYHNTQSLIPIKEHDQFRFWQKKLALDLAVLVAVRQVTNHQIKVLSNLRDIIERSRISHWRPSQDESGYNLELIDIPVISTINSTRINCTLQMISTVEGEISNFQNRISQMAKVLQKFNGQVTEREELQKTIQTSAKEQIRQAEKIADEISFQGRNISFVTLLTVLFLPLGFFAQFFSRLEALKEFSQSQAKFWMVAGPVTGVIMIVASYYLMVSRYESRKMLLYISNWFHWRYADWPLKISDASAQEKFLNGLPKYKIRMESETSPEDLEYLLEPNESTKLKIDSQPVKFGPCENIQNNSPGTFRFDKKNGFIFLDFIDKHDYMYYVEITSTYWGPQVSDRDVVWRKIRQPYEKTPLGFKGKFHKSGNDLIGALATKPRTFWYEDKEPELRRTFWYEDKEPELRKSDPADDKKVVGSLNFFACRDGDARYRVKDLGIDGLFKGATAKRQYYKMKLEPVISLDDE
ncbi:Protein of unknown function [Pyronema omphalodes CBS 100304]|uniref:Uncharacterized protein n=1 Tax=Pyronema omphalodes (strain CBS 100304) TaxID=1076935 RepID=U4L8K9_PYROM|nr:Protein of unknown function [Pyronema omphalodes CBS 100304]